MGFLSKPKCTENSIVTQSFVESGDGIFCILEREAAIWLAWSWSLDDSPSPRSSSFSLCEKGTRCFDRMKGLSCERSFLTLSRWRLRGQNSREVMKSGSFIQVFWFTSSIFVSGVSLHGGIQDCFFHPDFIQHNRKHHVRTSTTSRKGERRHQLLSRYLTRDKAKDIRETRFPLMDRYRLSFLFLIPRKLHLTCE